MSAEPRSISPEVLLEHEGFLRGLARSLVYPHEQPEDVVQDTLAYALQRPPREGPGLRSWLSHAARNFLRQDRRARGRREARERKAARPEAVSVEAALARESARRGVVEAVTRLAEPYRTAVVLRYLEGLPPREISRKTGEPVETVRTRLKRALARLRGDLDREHGGDRRAWTLLLLPLANRDAAAPAASSATGIGAIIMSAKAKLGLSVVVLLLLGGAIFLSWPRGESPPPARPDAPDPAPTSTVADGVPVEPPPPGPAPVPPPEPAERVAAVGLTFTDGDGKPLPPAEVAARYAAAGIPLVVQVVSEEKLSGGNLLDTMRRILGPATAWRRGTKLVIQGDRFALEEPPEKGRWRIFLGRPDAAPMLTDPVDIAVADGLDLSIPLPDRVPTQRIRLLEGSSGRPLAGATLTPWFEYGDDEAFLRGPLLTSDSNGEVSLPFLEKSVMAPRQRQPVYWVQAGAGLALVDLGTPSAVTGSPVREISVFPPATVEGEAWLSNGMPAAGCQVLTMYKARVVRTTVGDDGRYTLRGVAVPNDSMGRVRLVLVEDLARMKVSMEDARIRAGETTRIDFGSPQATPGGGVIHGRFSVGSVGQPNILLAVRADATGKRYIGSTDEAGEYIVEELPAGGVKVSALFGDPRVCDDFELASEELIQLADGEKRRLDFDLPGGVLIATLLDAESGAPVTGGGVHARPERREAERSRFPGFKYRPGWAGLTGADGTVRLPALIPGEDHSITASAPGYREATVTGKRPGTATEPGRVTIRLARAE